MRGQQFVRLVSAIMGIFVGTEVSAQEISTTAVPPPDWIAETRFTNVRAVRKLDDGVLVADRAETRLVFLPWGNRADVPVGRTGRGPGEYQGIGQLYSFHGRWNLLVGSDITATVPEHGRFNRLFRKRFSGADTLGNVLARPDFLLRNRQIFASADSVLLLIGNRRTGEVDTLGYLKGPGSEGATTLPPRDGHPRALLSTNPLAAGDPALLFPDGWIAVVRVEPYRVDWRTPDGQWMAGAPLPFVAREVTRAEQCSAIARMMGPDRPCEPHRLPGWPKIVPPFLESTGDPAIYAAPDGSVVIKRTPVLERPGRRFDVVDRRGRLIRVLQLPEDVTIVGFGEQSIYTLLTNELDLQTLRRHALPW